MSCSELASSLSAQYRNTSFDGAPKRGTSASPSLNDYLATHGLLLTMCFPNSCSLGFGAQFFSASWIQKDLGPRVIPSSSGVGLILDPSLVNIQCLYPTDAGTLGRDGKGCGPMSSDRNGGSQGAASYNKNPIKRYMYRKFVTDYKNLNFGRDTKWEDIDCMEFFDLPSIEGGRLWGFIDEDGNNSTWVQNYSSPVLANLNVAAIMGHDLCSVDVLPESFVPFPIYYDAHSWAPEDFKELIELEMEFIHNQTTSVKLWVWNELVLSLPTELPPLVQGVFYVNENYTGERMKRREVARRQAKTFGDLPVFVLHNEENWHGDILECDGQEHDMTVEEALDSNSDHFSKTEKLTSLQHKNAHDIAKIQTYLRRKRRDELPIFDNMQRFGLY